MKLVINSSPLWLFACLVCAATFPAWAQEQAAETLNLKMGAPTAPSLTNSVAAVAKNPDLGQIAMVQQYPKPETLTISTTQQFFYTDNVFFTEGNPLGSSAYLGSYSASYVPYSLADWTPRITLQYGMVRYDTVPSGDFDYETLSLSSQYLFSEDQTWSWTADIDVSQYTAPHDNNHAFYQEVVYDNQINKVIPLSNHIPLFLIGSYDLAYHQANPDAFDRLDNSISFGLIYHPIPTVTIAPFVRPSCRIYMTNTPVQSERKDFNLSEGIDVAWQPVKYADLSADFINANDYSSAGGQSYNQSSPGVSLTGEVKFW